MTNQSDSTDRREFFRCDLSKLGDKAVLRTNRRDYLVEMVEESAGGFGLRSETAIQTSEGAVLSMAYRGGCFEVEVAHITHNEEETRVGLKRLKELKFLHSDGWLGIFSWREMNSTRGLVVASMFLLALTLAGFLWGAWLPESAKPQWSALLKGQWREEEQEAGGKPEPKNEASPEDREKQIVEQIGLLANDNWTNQLNVSEEQNQKIEAIVRDTTKRLQKIYQQGQSADDPSQWSHAGLKLIRDSWADIENVLTEEQREKWRNIRNKVAANQ